MDPWSTRRPVVVEVWRDFDVWPAEAAGPAGALDRAAALGVAVEVASGLVGGAADAATDASAPDLATSDASGLDDAAAAFTLAEAADAEVTHAEAAQEPDADAAEAGEGPDVPVSGGVWESGLAQLVSRWWVATCPGWVCPQWAEVRLWSPVRDLLTLPPGPELITAVAAIPTGVCRVDHRGEELPGIEPVPGTEPGWACACQVVIAAAWEACASWTQLQAATTLVATAGAQPVIWPAPSRCGGGVTDPIAEELAPALRLSPASMGNRIASARRLAAVPAITMLVADGLLGAGPARLIADDLDVFPADDVAAVTTEVAARVRARARSGLRAWTGTEVRQKVARALLRLGSAKVAKARKQARRGRRVTLTPESNGMAWLNAYMSAVDAARVYARLTAIAKGIDDPDRGIDAKRCDLLIDAVLTSRPTTDAEPAADAEARDPAESRVNADADADADADAEAETEPDAGAGADTGSEASVDSRADAAAGPRPADRRATPRPRSRRAPADICVVVNLTTLLGLNDDPAEVPGVGPIPAQEARELAADGQWRAWITDAATGQVIDTGRRTYTPSTALARLIRAREPYCRMTGCRRRAVNCDLDHTIPFPTGLTEESNLGPLCRRHHRLKTHHKFGLQPNSDPDVTGPETGPPEPTGLDTGPPEASGTGGTGGPEASGTGGTGGTGRPGNAWTGWTWTMPSGLTYRDTPDPHLDP